MKEDNKYTVADLLGDERFISSVNRPSLENEAFWAAMRREGRVTDEDCELARYCIRSFHPSGKALTSEEAADLWTNIRMETARRKVAGHRRVLLYRLLPAACALAAVCCWFVFRPSTALMTPLAAEIPAPKIEDVARPDSVGRDIRIIFSSEESMTLKEKTADIIYNGKGEAEVNSHVVSQSVKPAAETSRVAYNQVVVPPGRHTSLTLGDGTKLWINASSRVVYPPVFDGEKREIYLEGEAYLEVTPAAARPFTVKTSRMEILALGTAFNVSAYDGEPSQTVVLVTGAVAVKTGKETGQVTEMAPNQLFQVAGQETKLRNVTVANYISWKDGLYIYKDEALSLILNRLAHYYGATIRFSPEAGALRFTGKLDLKTDLERVLNGLSNTAPVRCRKENGETFYLYTNP
ncbi:MAG: FecR domain-containing protein [Tannerella sp.]|jgi:ferric-dicitrate binding protein FerR (iron transport regulator)|nr:FecR domain-containing protein [Tannerella sp.]